MSNFTKLKAIIFLFVIQLAATTTVFGVGIKTESLDSQDNALIDSSSLAGNSNLATILSILIKTALGFLGIVFLLLTILAGFKWMTSQGNEEEIKKAQQSLKNSVIGLIIVLAAYAITYSIFNYLPFASGGSGGGGGGTI